jgi:spore germination cell wall hydrolase CwlJ-like protein
MRTIIKFIVAVLALTVIQLGHAEETAKGFLDNALEVSRDQLDNWVQTISKPWITFKVTSRDEECLARNIYFEAGSEPEEGKAAVGIVTVNRVKDGGFGKTICAVVNQRTMFVRSTVVPTTEYVQTGLFGGAKPVTTNKTVISYVPVCQFSWVCAFVRVPRISNPAWEESQRVAHSLLNEGYEEYRKKYEDALYFHSTGTRPLWAQHKNPIARIGGHIFYGERI